MSLSIQRLYLCQHHHTCVWNGSLQPQDRCPACGRETYTTPCLRVGCTLFYRLGRNLRVRNTTGPMQDQEGHVEQADLGDLMFFVDRVWS